MIATVRRRVIGGSGGPAAPSLKDKAKALGVVVDGKVVHAGGVPRDPHAAPAILGPRAGLAQSGRHRSEMQRRLRNLPLSRWVCEGISQGTE